MALQHSNGDVGRFPEEKNAFFRTLPKLSEQVHKCTAVKLLAQQLLMKSDWFDELHLGESNLEQQGV